MKEMETQVNLGVLTPRGVRRPPRHIDEEGWWAGEWTDEEEMEEVEVEEIRDQKKKGL